MSCVRVRYLFNLSNAQKLLMQVVIVKQVLSGLSRSCYFYCVLRMLVIARRINDMARQKRNLWSNSTFLTRLGNWRQPITSPGENVCKMENMHVENVNLPLIYWTFNVTHTRLRSLVLKISFSNCTCDRYRRQITVDSNDMTRNESEWFFTNS